MTRGIPTFEDIGRLPYGLNLLLDCTLKEIVFGCPWSAHSSTSMARGEILSMGLVQCGFLTGAILPSGNCVGYGTSSSTRRICLKPLSGTRMTGRQWLMLKRLPRFEVRESWDLGKTPR